MLGASQTDYSTSQLHTTSPVHVSNLTRSLNAAGGCLQLREAELQGREGRMQRKPGSRSSLLPPAIFHQASNPLQLSEEGEMKVRGDRRDAATGEHLSRRPIFRRSASAIP